MVASDNTCNAACIFKLITGNLHRSIPNHLVAKVLLEDDLSRKCMIRAPGTTRTSWKRQTGTLRKPHQRRGTSTARPPAWLALKSRRGLSYVVHSGYEREKGSSRPLTYEARQQSFRRPGKPFIPQPKSNGRGICHMDKKRKPGALETIIRLTPKRAGLARKDETVFPSARTLIQALQLITNQTRSRNLDPPWTILYPAHCELRMRHSQSGFTKLPLKSAAGKRVVFAIGPTQSTTSRQEPR